MPRATVHNITREAIRAGDVYVGRIPAYPHKRKVIQARAEGVDGFFGNPYQIGVDGDRQTVISRFQEYAAQRVTDDPEYRSRVAALHGKRLFCWCAPQDCHADVLADLAASLVEEEESDA